MVKGNAQQGDKQVTMKEVESFVKLSASDSIEERKSKYLFALNKVAERIFRKNKHHEILNVLESETERLSNMENPTNRSLMNTDLILQNALGFCRNLEIPDNICETFAQETFDLVKGRKRLNPLYHDILTGDLLVHAAVYYWYHKGSRKSKVLLERHSKNAEKALDEHLQRLILRFKSWRGVCLIEDAMRVTSDNRLRSFFEKDVLSSAHLLQCKDDLRKSKNFISKMFVRRDVADVQSFRSGLDLYLDKIEDLSKSLKQESCIVDQDFLENCYACVLGSMRYARKVGHI